MPETTPLARKSNLVVQEIENEILIYDLKANKALSLNETSKLVWELATGNRTISEIALEISRKLKIPVGEELVWLALGQLKKEKLLENETEISISYQGATRREIIKKVGYSSLVALPIITSIIAPTSIQAQSNCGTVPRGLGCSCVVNGLPNSGNCASGCCNFPQGGTSGNCVPMGGSLGAVCAMNCQCDSACCGGAGFGCIAPNSKPIGTPCQFTCECVAGTTCLGTTGNAVCT